MDIGRIHFQDVADLDDDDEISFYLDTAGSWDGCFPPAYVGDYLVRIGTINGERNVIVSRRYTAATDAESAAALALDAVREREGFPSDDEGDPSEIEIGSSFGVPVWVASVDAIHADEDEDIDDFDTSNDGEPLGEDEDPDLLS